MNLVIETTALSKFYGTLQAVDEVDLRVCRGDSVDLAGNA
jgi:ABC-type branched-subunit amino acid transport system ATPase component